LPMVSAHGRRLAGGGWRRKISIGRSGAGERAARQNLEL